MRKLALAGLVVAGLLASGTTAEYRYSLPVALHEETRVIQQQKVGRYELLEIPWPVAGRINSYMDASHPFGIDIDTLYYEELHNKSQPVFAVDAGEITFIGGDPCCSYGLYIEIKHDNRLNSLYAHLGRFSDLKVGDRVKKCQQIGYAGVTGYSTGPHLHFELFDKGIRVNPLDYLGNESCLYDKN